MEIPAEYQCSKNCYLYKRGQCGFNIRYRGGRSYQQQFDYCPYPFPGSIRDPCSRLDPPLTLTERRDKFQEFLSSITETDGHLILSSKKTRLPSNQCVARTAAYEASFKKFRSLVSDFQHRWKSGEEVNYSNLISSYHVASFVKKAHIIAYLKEHDIIEDSSLRIIFDESRDIFNNRYINRNKKKMKINVSITKAFHQPEHKNTRTGEVYEQTTYTGKFTDGENLINYVTFILTGDKMRNANLQVGDLVTLSIRLDTRVWNGQDFNDVKSCFFVEKII